MFNLPNHIEGTYSSGKGLILSKNGQSPASGSMVLRVTNEETQASWLTARDLKSMWKAFVERGMLETSIITGKSDTHGALSAHAILERKGSRTITFVMPWYFPYRPHTEEILGNYYSNLYTSADVWLIKLSHGYHQLGKQSASGMICFDNFLPDWLQDVLINSAATMYKTGMWFKDGRWRQWESFSCPVVDPLHIHFYRSLPYAFFFFNLQQNILKGFAKTQRDDGCISHDLCDTKRPLDTPAYTRENCTQFLLEIYMNYL
ncbi:MAG: GH116 family glycosyl-hydrolase [Candidatus Hadarchaeaceae archaeon]